MTNRFIYILLLALCGYTATAQRVVKGKVIESADSLPLRMTTVLLKGTTQGTSTDSLGRFSLSVPETGGVLIFRFLGYVTLEVPFSQMVVGVIKMEPDFTVLLQSSISCYFPSNSLNIQWLSGFNHTPYGIAGRLQLASFKSPFGFRYLQSKAVISVNHQFFKDNRTTTIRLSRFENFRIVNQYFRSTLELSNRKILLTNEVQELKELGLTQSTNTKLGRFGLGASLQTEQFESTTRKSLALVAEWEDYVLNSLTAKLQVKRWQEATQVKWNLSHYFYRPNLLISLNGIHYKNYNELSLGVAYQFNF